MKKAYLISGIIIVILAAGRGINYYLDFRELTPEQQQAFYEYHSGHLAGTAVIFVLGLVLIFAGVRRKKTR